MRHWSMCIAWRLAPGAARRRQRGQWRDGVGRQAALAHLQALCQGLLLRAACCVQLEPALLRALRETDAALRAQPALEAWAWTSQPLVGSSRLSRPLAPEAAARYRGQFHTLPAAQRLAVLQAMLDHHASQGRSTESLEASLWQTHAHLPPQACGPMLASRVAQAQAWLQRMAADLAGEGGPPGPQDPSFARDLLGRQAADQHWLAAQSPWMAKVFAATALPQAPAGLQAQDLARSLSRHAAGPLRACRLMQHGGGLWLWPAGLALPYGASPLTLPRDADTVIVQARGGPAHWLRAVEAPLGRAALGRGGAPLQVMLGGHSLLLQARSRPAWAQVWGRDAIGLWAEFKLSSAGAAAAVVQRLRWIEPGSFWMGSPEDEHEREAAEGPRHRVTITQGFWLADTACTQALWLAVMGQNPSQFKGDEQRPVDSVSWDDVQGFLGKLQTQLPGCEAMLPTEARWEYACRAGTETPFSFGQDITPALVNYDGNHPYRGRKKGQYREQTVAVKSLPANAWGLYEMHGNVWEWCADDPRRYDGEAQVDPAGAIGPSAEGHRALRGGAWFNLASSARSALRRFTRPGRARRYFGFRLCLRSPEPGAGTAGVEGRDGPLGPGGPGLVAPAGRPKSQAPLASAASPRPRGRARKPGPP